MAPRSPAGLGGRRLDLKRILFDPGIGFGKNPLQSLELLRGAGRLRKHGLRTVIGHSRKSFMKSFTSGAVEDRDLATIGISLELCRQGVDILRVHNVPDHIAAYRGWSHLIR
ncbi:MAG: dihydropteroate synthase [bacterium]|nr:dihydropteroate synthase [bacterium]